jgi:hypothetical protein
MRGRLERLAVGACVALAAACSDPRARPVPPQIAFAFDTAQVVRSPGLVVGRVDITASGGIDFIHLTLGTTDSSFFLDTLEGYAGEGQLSRQIQWSVDPGMAVGTTLLFTVLVRDFADFEKADTIAFTTQP